MATKVLVLVAMMVTTTLAQDGVKIQARGMDEGPWSMMNQQPEVLIVKEKGGMPTNGGTMGMSMKDLTPIICLLAPLLLAAIMIPAKMTMMMNNMMGNMGNGMFPMLPMIPMLPNGMLPMLPNGMLPGIPGLPLSAMLTSGSHSLQLPVFKGGVVSKEFVGKEFTEENQVNDTLTDNEDTNAKADCAENKDCKKGQLNLLLSRKNLLLKHKMRAFKRFPAEINKEWSNRVFSERKHSNRSIANQILKLIDVFEKALQINE
ncbi:uncharacterized protein CDAR_290541 [Caerostris darwini]|uniref:Uncharacterized protein n=1 Tax=Caerostris darwini TaxID=1538125 RepID=A0AAV4N4V2_9ARAC|nr:uncharacterized protein CDAR_290541 [Caerostris darwini]